ASGNFNKLKIDRTNWYSINYEKVDELKADDNETHHEVEEKAEIPQPDLEESKSSNRADDVLKVDRPSAQNEQSKCSKWTDDVPNMNTAIPEITSEITTENTSETSSSKNKGEKEDEK